MNDDDTIVIPKHQWLAIYRLQQFVHKARRMPPFENDRKAILEDILDNISGTITELIKVSITISSTIGGIKNTDVYVPVHIVEAQAIEIKNYAREIKDLKFENKKYRSEVIILEKSPREITEQRRSAKRRIRKIEETLDQTKLRLKESLSERKKLIKSVDSSKTLINELEEELRKKGTKQPIPTKQMLRAIEKAREEERRKISFKTQEKAFETGVKVERRALKKELEEALKKAKKQAYSKGLKDGRKDTINEIPKEKNDDVV